MSQGVEWGLHCTLLLAALPPGMALPAGRLAEFHGVPPASLAKHLQALSQAGIVESTQGPGGGYRLARPARGLSVLDVVEAIEGTAPAFRCTEIRQRGPAAGPRREYTAPCAVHRVMAEAEEAWRASLRAVSIADLGRAMAANVSAPTAVKAVRWVRRVAGA